MLTMMGHAEVLKLLVLIRLAKNLARAEVLN